jgi:Tol biopolymer transport system component
MKIPVKISIYPLAIVGILCFIMSSCRKHDIIEEEDPFKVITLTPPTDKIPYEALGGGKILFYRSDYIIGDISINMIDVDKKRTSAFKLNSLMLQPSISPDGSKIVFSLFMNVTTAYDIYVMNTDGSDCYLVYQSEYQDRYPTWTIDGSKILVFNASRYGPLYMQSPVENTTDRVELTRFYYDDDLSWFIEPSGGFSISPGQKIVCSNLINQIRGLLSIEPYVGKSGVSLLLPTPTDQHFESPAFSPDGSKIAFLVVETDPLKYGWNAVVLKTINPDGSNLSELIRVTPFKTPVDWMHYSRVCDVSLCWSPDGKKILFTYPTEENGCHLFVINSDGTGLTQVTDNIQGYDVDVSWGR